MELSAKLAACTVNETGVSMPWASGPWSAQPQLAVPSRLPLDPVVARGTLQRSHAAMSILVTAGPPISALVPDHPRLCWRCSR